MKASRELNRRAQAFTLMEVLIAVVVSSIVLAAVSGVFYGAMKLRDKTTRALEKSLPIQQAVSIIRRDLLGIVVPGGTLTGTLKTAVGSTSTGGDMPLGAEFYTSTGLPSGYEPWGDVQKVAYYLRSPTNQTSLSGMDLVRSVTRNLLANVQEQTEEQWLLGDVKTVGMQFYSGTEWRSEWDSTTEEKALPRAIRVDILLVAEDAQSERIQNPIQIVVPIVTQSSTNKTQAAGGQG